ncbi:MAG: hypothetical protein ACREL4_03750 [Gemmatimonadales bacterium]
MRHRAFAALCLSLAAAPLTAQQPRDFGPYLIADRAAEIALARTAAPANVSDSATVLVMTRTGFVEAAHGTNGFTCAVFRSFAAPSNNPNVWNSKIRAPQCFNAAAVRSVLPAMLKRMEWILAGTTPAEADVRTERDYASHQFPSPESGAMAYMLSRDQYLNDTHPNWMPHVMFYYDKSLPGSALGALDDGAAPIIDGSADDPHAAILTVFIPVRRWSDGSTALPPAGH